MGYTTRGKIIYPDMIVDLFLEEGEDIQSCCSSSFRLLIVESGSILVKMQGKRILIEAPAVYCLNNQDELNVVKTSKFKFKTIYFKPAVINSRFGDNFIEQGEYNSLSFTEMQDLHWLYPFVFDNDDFCKYIKLGPTSLKRIVFLYNSLEKELDDQSDNFWPCRSRSIFLEMLYLVYNLNKKYDNFKNEINPQMDLSEEILLYLHTNYMDDISISTLVSQFNTNRTKINELFINSMGKSVIAYLIDIRIKLACLILRDTTIPVKEVAYKTGFNDINHFGRTFKKNTSYSPTQYRKELNWMLN